MAEGRLRIIESHNSTTHDGGVAIYEDGKIFGLAAERADRIKHSLDSKKSYMHLLRYLNKSHTRVFDYFDPRYKPFQELHHHLAHASSAFYPSSFNEAAVLVVDGIGPYRDNKFASTSFWLGKGEELKLLDMTFEDYPCYDSLGHFYSSITFYLGFDFFDPAKTMSLAAYGKDSRYYDEMCKLVRLTRDGHFHVDKDFVYLSTFLTLGNSFGWTDKEGVIPNLKDKYENIFGPVRKPNSEITSEHMNIAWAAQRRLEESLIHLTNQLFELTNTDNLCMAGGVALNVVANERLANEGPFRNIFVQPAAGDDGQALGKLLFRMYNQFNLPRKWMMRDAYLGPEYSPGEVIYAIDSHKDKLIYRKSRNSALLRDVVSFIKDGKIIGWFQGRSELGPRALGHRSILADPRRKEIKSVLDKVKHREWFRPYAPSTLLEGVKDYFYLNEPSPFMLRAVKVREDKKTSIPAVVHVDGTSRVQTVTEQNGLYYDLIKEFERQTGVPLLLNTSFNDKDEPIVETPIDAVNTFLRMALDYLVINNYIVHKK